MSKKRALISVSDKTGVLEFAKSLVKYGYEIISTGGTLKSLQDGGVPAISVSDVTGFPECLDGRVKTLHPKVHAGLLAKRSDPAHMKTLKELDVTPIDLVAVNLYPFKETVSKKHTLAEAVENIDIGGPAMIRSAAKNYKDVAVLTDPADYKTVTDELAGGGISEKTKFYLMYKAFAHTAQYDAIISNYFAREQGITAPQDLTLTYTLKQSLRYGENPHQAGVFYADIFPSEGGVDKTVQLHGKELSYNNILDISNALDLLYEFDAPACVAVKHNNACGAAVGKTLTAAYLAAYECDPVSIFGGIIALNGAVEKTLAEELSKTFLEAVIAESFTPDALEILTKKKNIRLLTLAAIGKKPVNGGNAIRSVAGGLLVQDADLSLYKKEELKTVTRAAPTKKEMSDLDFAFKVVKHVKSNAIVIAKDGKTVGLGIGQVNRIWALNQAAEHAGGRARGAVLASDAFFPFDDCVKAAAAAGITAIIQPGGSTRDQDSIDAANAAGISMVFTGERHFKH